MVEYISKDLLVDKLEIKIGGTLEVMRTLVQNENSIAWVSLATRVVILREVLAEINCVPFDSKEEMWKLLND